MGDEDRRKYYFAQQAQQTPTGAYMDVGQSNRGHVYELGKGDWSESVDSIPSGDETAPQNEDEHSRQFSNRHIYRPSSPSGTDPFGQHDTQPSHYLQTHSARRQSQGGSSPPFAPVRPSRLSNGFRPPDDDELSASLLMAPPAASLNASHGRPMRSERPPLANTPLIRVPTGSQVESFEMDDPRRHDDPLPNRPAQTQRMTRDPQPSQQEVPLMSDTAGSTPEARTKEKKERRRLFKRHQKK